jgi:hypothetical protein
MAPISAPSTALWIRCCADGPLETGGGSGAGAAVGSVGSAGEVGAGGGLEVAHPRGPVRPTASATPRVSEAKAGPRIAPRQGSRFTAAVLSQRLTAVK